jgi:hypothetical protein
VKQHLPEEGGLYTKFLETKYACTIVDKPWIKTLSWACTKSNLYHPTGMPWHSDDQTCFFFPIWSLFPVHQLCFSLSGRCFHRGTNIVVIKTLGWSTPFVSGCLRVYIGAKLAQQLHEDYMLIWPDIPWSLRRTIQGMWSGISFAKTTYTQNVTWYSTGCLT